MRWGVRNEATVDHSASTLCMQEIEACKKLSIGPTFVVKQISFGILFLKCQKM